MERGNKQTNSRDEVRPVIRFGEIIVDLLKFQFIRRNHGFAGKCFILFLRGFWHLPSQRWFRSCYNIYFKRVKNCTCNWWTMQWKLSINHQRSQILIKENLILRSEQHCKKSSFNNATWNHAMLPTNLTSTISDERTMDFYSVSVQPRHLTSWTQSWTGPIKSNLALILCPFFLMKRNQW